MFDYISIELENRLISSLLNDSRLNFATRINEETGELIVENYYYRKKEAKFQNLVFTINTNILTNESKLILNGSIHKLHTGGVNHTDFNLNALIMSLNSLKIEFNIDLTQSFIHSIEFGVNVRIPFSCKSTLDNLLSYRSIKPTEDLYFGKGQMFKFILKQYTIKIYNKSLEGYTKGTISTNTDDLMRYEVHVDRMAYLHKKGIEIRTLSDLLNADFHAQLGILLTDTFNEVVIYDSSIKRTFLSPENISFMTEANNPKYWQTLRLKSGRKMYSRKLKKFRHIISDNTELDLQLTIGKLIENKWNELSDNVPKLPTVQNAQMSRNYTYIVGNNETLNKRFCTVTEIEITHQSGKRNYLSEKSIDIIMSTDLNLYYTLLQKYGPRVYSEKVNEDIAHNIRNAHTNQYHGLKRRIIKSLSQTSLFNADEVLTLTSEQRNLLATY